MPSSNKQRSRFSGSHVWGHHAARSRTPAREHPRTKRRKRLLFILIALGVVLMLLCGFLIWGSHQSEVRIAQVSVFGLEQQPEEPVKLVVQESVVAAGAHWLARDNTLLFPRGTLTEQLLTAFPRFKEVHVSVRGMETPSLAVTVTERQAAGLWCSDDSSCFHLDESGFIFDEADAYAEFVRFYGGNVATSSEAIGAVYTENFSSLLGLIDELHIHHYDTTLVHMKGDEVTLTLANGLEVRTVRSDSRSHIVSALDVVLSSEVLRGRGDELEYIDLRFGNRVYYKFKDGEEEAAGNS